MEEGAQQISEESPETRRKDIPAIIEALLFVYGSPVPISRLANIIGISENDIRLALSDLRGQYASASRGLALIENGDEVQLASASEVAPYVEKLMKEEFREDLTSHALETLAIVSYRGPISRSEVDFIRGVNSSFMLRHLLIRGLISREVDPKRSNVYLYRPSSDFLRLLGITRREDLPDFEELSKRLEEIKPKEEGESSSNDVSSTPENRK